jgi:hypothetical protein
MCGVCLLVLTVSFEGSRYVGKGMDGLLSALHPPWPLSSICCPIHLAGDVYFSNLTERVHVVSYTSSYVRVVVLIVVLPAQLSLRTATCTMHVRPVVHGAGLTAHCRQVVNNWVLGYKSVSNKYRIKIG